MTAITRAQFLCGLAAPLVFPAVVAAQVDEGQLQDQGRMVTLYVAEAVEIQLYAHLATLAVGPKMQALIRRYRDEDRRHEAGILRSITYTGGSTDLVQKVRLRPRSFLAGDPAGALATATTFTTALIAAYGATLVFMRDNEHLSESLVPGYVETSARLAELALIRGMKAPPTAVADPAAADIGQSYFDADTF